MEKLEAGFKPAFRYTGGHFLFLVALIPNPLKCSSFQRPVRVLAMREFRPTDLGGGGGGGKRETKRDTRQRQKGPIQDSSTWSQTLFAGLSPSTGENSILQTPTFSTSQCPGALTCMTLYIQNCLGSDNVEEFSIQLCFNLLYTQRLSFSSARWQESLSHGAPSSSMSQQAHPTSWSHDTVQGSTHHAQGTTVQAGSSGYSLCCQKCLHILLLKCQTQLDLGAGTTAHNFPLPHECPKH